MGSPCLCCRLFEVLGAHHLAPQCDQLLNHSSKALAAVRCQRCVILARRRKLIVLRGVHIDRVGKHVDFWSLAKLLQITLSNEPFDIALSHEELTVLRQVDRAAKMLENPATQRLQEISSYPYSVWISPASFNTRTSINKSFGGSKLPVRSISVHRPLYAASRSPYWRKYSSSSGLSEL